MAAPVPDGSETLPDIKSAAKKKTSEVSSARPHPPTDGLAMNHCLLTEMVPKPDTVTTFGIRRARNRPVWQESCRTRTLAQAHPPRQGEGAPQESPVRWPQEDLCAGGEMLRRHRGSQQPQKLEDLGIKPNAEGAQCSDG